jgi:hypothetical protein
MVEGAQLSNSFIILMALDESKEPLNTTQISQIIALNTGGQIYKISATLKDSLEHRLKREGYVESTDLTNKSLFNFTKSKKAIKGMDCISFSLLIKLSHTAITSSNTMTQIPGNNKKE